MMFDLLLFIGMYAVVVVPDGLVAVSRFKLECIKPISCS